MGGSEMLVNLEHVENAHAAGDPQAVDLLLQVISAPPDPNQPPPREGTYGFDAFLKEISRPKFYKQPAEVQALQRQEKLKAVEANDPDDIHPRYRSHEFIYRLWESAQPFDRKCLLEIIRRVPLVYGPWKALKAIFKEAESREDTEVMGALAARFDVAFSSGQHSVSNRTLGYLTRRAWRYLRQLAKTLPACYADRVVDFLVPFPDSYPGPEQGWLWNQIFHHDQKAHGRSRFRSSYRWKRTTPVNYHTSRAFPELWKRSPLPLFELLQRAQNTKVLKYAVAALKTDFRTVLRAVEPVWVRQLIHRDNATVHEFAVWVLENVPQFEQSKFRELELHDAVLQLLQSPSGPARSFAAKYARVHARDLPVESLVRYAINNDPKVRDLAKDLLSSLDPRNEVGLDAWGLLLRTRDGNELAQKVLRKHFVADDLTPEWFADQLLSGNKFATQFAQSRCLELHSPKQLGEDFFFQLFDRADPDICPEAITFALNEYGKFDLSAVEISRLEMMLVHRASTFVVGWANQGLLAPSRFDPSFLKSIAFAPTYNDTPQVVEAKQKPWGKYVVFYTHISNSIFEWFSDIRQFTPDQIGFEWLMKLVQRDEPEYREFASDLLIKSYLPADFADDSQGSSEPEPATDSDVEIKVDLESATFVFTGKMATMTRSEAQKKVTEANGKNSKTVGKNLDYLVIGDEGSPMYGMGRKGSKQLKAESLNQSGAEVRIISETAFLQMLSGTQREFSEDAVIAGCENIWSMLLDNKEGSSLSLFAIKYVRHHHPEICLAETDRPVDPGSEFPDEFLNYDRVAQLLSHKQLSLRNLGLELCRYEFARMNPSLEQLVELCQLPYPPVRKFIASALTESPTVENRRWRLDPEGFTAESVYLFCQSRDAETRAIGMKLIDLYPRMREPDQLFALTESPDRNVRAFVIRSFWSLYRDRGGKQDWRPTDPAESLLKKKKKPKPGAPETPRFGTGAPPRPDDLPAAPERMQFLLRRLLFEIAPGRPPKSKGDEIDELKVKPLPTRRAKILLIETIRDLALEDQEFAEVVHPVLVEFMESHGMSEHAACLVAVTRIEHAFPELKASQTEVEV